MMLDASLPKNVRATPSDLEKLIPVLNTFTIPLLMMK
jgi:hypothetical protein